MAPLLLLLAGPRCIEQSSGLVLSTGLVESDLNSHVRALYAGGGGVETTVTLTLLAG
jgi:hypothetical protein